MKTEDRPRVLVVDDEASNVETALRGLRKDLTMVGVTSAKDALDRMADQPFDVILTDYAMPDMNGIELLTRMQQQYPNVGRILVTAHAELPEVKAAKGHLVAAIIMKPWVREDVVRWVQHARGVAEMRRQVEKMNARLSDKPKA